MMKNIKNISLISLFCISSITSLSAITPNDDKECTVNYERNIVHFADEHNPHNRLITLNYKTMQLLKTEEVEGSLTHHADVLGTVDKANYMMMVPKGSNFITIRDIKSGDFVKKIRLPFRPRSADAYNPRYNLTLLNSRDRPSAVLIDNISLKIVGKAGFNISCNQPNILPPYSYLYSQNNIDNLTCQTSDFGGDQISGHPIWINSNTFVLLDRSNRLLHIYNMRRYQNQWKTHLVQTIKTDTSLHQLIPKSKRILFNRTFYGMTESTSTSEKISGVYKFRRRGSRLIKMNFTKLRYYISPYYIRNKEINIKNRYRLFPQLPIFRPFYKQTKIEGINGHNLFMTPNRRYIYAPVGATLVNGQLAPGGVFVLNSFSMRIVNFIKTGYGAGHVAFSRQKGIAIVTNHKDKFLTAIDFRQHKFIKNIPLNFINEGIFSLTTSHAQHIDKSGNYYYNFWTDGGQFFRVDLNRLVVDKSVRTGGIPIQGNFYPEIAMNCNIPAPAKEDGYDEIFPNDIIPVQREIVEDREENNRHRVNERVKRSRMNQGIKINRHRVNEEVESNRYNGYDGLTNQQYLRRLGELKK